MVARGWGVLPIHLAHLKEQGHAPIPAGDHEGPPFPTQPRSPLQIIRPPACLHGHPEPLHASPSVTLSRSEGSLSMLPPVSP